MGSSTSTQADSIDTHEKKTENANYGLFNISDESSGGINWIEIVTLVMVCLAAFIFIKAFCEKRRKKRLNEMHQHLAGIIPDHPLGVPPPAARAIQPAAPAVSPPPLYPGGQIASTMMMGKYDI